MEFRIGQLPDDRSLRLLYEDAGWTVYTRDMVKLRQALAQSMYLLCVWDGQELIGLLRAVGDGVAILYIQDILVRSSYRRRGVGRAMVQRALEAFPDVRQRVLMTDETPQMHGFYEGLGFFPSDKVGLTAFYYMGE